MSRKDRSSIRARWRYRLDNVMARGTPAMVAALCVLTLVVVVLTVVLLVVFGLPSQPALPLGELMWLAFIHAFDPSSIANDQGWAFRAVMFVSCVGGLFILSALIGVLSSGIEHRLQTLRKGRSPVIESDHTVILGWNETIFTILAELVEANRNRSSSCIVVLSSLEKTDMEDAIRERLPETGRTTIVCRHGSTIDVQDVRITSPETSRAIIVLPESSGRDADTTTIKTLLALTNDADLPAATYSIVAGMTDPKMLDVGRIVGKQHVTLVLVEHFISQIMTQTARQPGLSSVYVELLDFGGDEMYFHRDPSLAGLSYAEIQMAFDDSTVIGVIGPDGTVTINPPPTSRYTADSNLIVITEDDDTIRRSSQVPVPAPIPPVMADLHQERPERTLILGWNDRVPTICQELQSYVAPGSTTVIVCPSTPDVELPSTPTMTVEVRPGRPDDRAVLDGVGCETFDNILIVSDDSAPHVQEADARTLVTLINVRDIAERTESHPGIVSEMLDDRNRALVSRTGSLDFIVSNKLNSLILSQLSENPRLARVFEELFSADGSEIYIKPVGRYVPLGIPVTFYHVVLAASAQGHTAIGYRRHGTIPAGETVINPRKSDSITFTDTDLLIVIAER